MNTSSSEEILHHTRKLKAQMGELIDHLRADITKVADPSAKAMFEASAEVVTGLVKTFDHYEQKSEAAWKNAES